MLDVAQKAVVGVRQRRPGTDCERVNLSRQVSAANDVEPLLDVVLVPEFGVLAVTLALKEGVQVKFVELSLMSDGDQLVGHLVGEQAHFREGLVRIRFTGMRSAKVAL